MGGTRTITRLKTVENTMYQFALMKNTITRAGYGYGGGLGGNLGNGSGMGLEENFGGGGTFHLKVSGTKTGNVGNKTIKLYWGDNVLATIGPANNITDWDIEAWLHNNSSGGA